MNPQNGPEITDIRPEMIFQAGQSPIHGYRVDFRSPSGVKSYVQVPRSDSLDKDVKEAVQLESDRLEATLQTHPRR
jgi:hypothetical protein